VQLPVTVVDPWIVNTGAVFPEGMVHVTCPVHVLPDEQAGIMSVVVELVIELHAFCTAVCEQEVAVITCALTGSDNSARSEIRIAIRRVIL
jgi:hypothetical protein